MGRRHVSYVAGVVYGAILKGWLRRSEKHLGEHLLLLAMIDP
ncbi:MAG: hypothetical protein PHD83_00370 [Caldisericia bacterium]|nr:hypothetical protein [Caldisericia bacterium]